MGNPVLDAARAKREKKAEKLSKLMEAPTAENRELTDVEEATFEEIAKELKGLDKQIKVLGKEAKRAAKAERAAAGAALGGARGGGAAVVTREPMTYDLDGRNGFFRDLAQLSIPAVAEMFDGRDKAKERMGQHLKEIEVEAQGNRQLAEQLEEVRRTPASLINQRNRKLGGESRTAPNTTAGTGGELVPPLWAMNLTAPFLRPGRVFANRITGMPLPAGIDVINIPKITLGTLTGPQVANNAPVVSQDFTTTSVSGNVNTYAGQSDISLQLLEQSPLQIDSLIFDDLGRDLAQRLDIAIIAGTGANGQHTGILLVSNASSPSVTQASAITVSSATFDNSASGGQYRSIVKGVNQIETLTFMALPPTAIWAHPRRTNFWATAADSTNRPLFLPAKYGQYNAYGTNEGSPTPEGVAGELFGLPVVKDSNMPTTCVTGAATGGTGDAIVVLNEDVPILYEGTVRLRALPEILSGTLGVRYQAYQYSAFIPNRFPQAISILTGTTGLAAPTF